MYIYLLLLSNTLFLRQNEQFNIIITYIIKMENKQILLLENLIT